jgi:ribosomal 30S subunit maturation factor RimM
VERLLPFIPTVVMKVDLAAGCIQVDWQRDW